MSHNEERREREREKTTIMGRRVSDAQRERKRLRARQITRIERDREPRKSPNKETKLLDSDEQWKKKQAGLIVRYGKHTCCKNI